MRQLSGHAAGYLYADNGHTNANVSLLYIYDQATAPGGVVRFKRILAHLEGRLSRTPLFRQRLERVPLGLDHPYWVDDEEFDLEYHVRHIALPKPGDWRQFCIQASRIHARALDFDRPLWELYVIEGLDSFLDLPLGSFALLLKTHLAAVDHAQLGELTALLHDSVAADDGQAQAEPPPEPWFADPPPGRLSLLAQGALHNLRAPLRLAGPVCRALREVAPAALGIAREALVQPEHLPVTRFNAVVSPHRVFDTRRFSDEEVASVRRLVPGASEDDVVLAVCGGALRRWLEAEGELPPGHSLSALLPTPAAASARTRPRLTWRHAALGTDIADPLARLAAVRSARWRAPDAVAQVIGNPLLAEVADQASAPLLALGRRLGRHAREAPRHRGNRRVQRGCHERRHVHVEDPQQVEAGTKAAEHRSGQIARIEEPEPGTPVGRALDEPGDGGQRRIESPSPGIDVETQR